MKRPRRRTMLLATMLLFACGAIVFWWLDDGGEVGRQFARIKHAKTKEEARTILGSPNPVISLGDPSRPPMNGETGPIADEDYPLLGDIWAFPEGELMIIFDKYERIRIRQMDRVPLYQRAIKWVRKRTGM